MTACNIFVAAHEARIFTDGAWLRADGTLDHLSPKVLALPHLSAVIATQGGSHLPALVGPAFTRMFTCFDEMVAGATAFMRNPPTEIAPLLASVPIERVFLVGYSDAAGCIVGRYMQNIDLPGRPAWEMAEIEWAIVSPPVPDIEAELIQTHERGERPETSVLVDLMQAQRDIAGEIGTGVVAPAVGGFCLLTTVTPDGIDMRVLRRWKDRTGEMIDPSRDIVMTSTMLGMEPPVSAGPRSKDRDLRRLHFMQSNEGPGA